MEPTPLNVRGSCLALGFERRKPMGRYVVRGTTLLTVITVVLTILVLPLLATAQWPRRERSVAAAGVRDVSD